MNAPTVEIPRLIEGGMAVDDRGQVAFVNDFHFSGVKRFYAVANHASGFVRAWHAHRHEAKFVFAAQGAAVVGAVAVDDWDNPSRNAQVHRFVLSAKRPSILYIPAGYANGFMSLGADTQLFFFSTSTMEEARYDDVRYDARHWDIWTVVER
jgi:dTDP-4-dehydrorhamnose 3,5-epimerase